MNLKRQISSEVGEVKIIKSLLLHMFKHKLIKYITNNGLVRRLISIYLTIKTRFRRYDIFIFL